MIPEPGGFPDFGSMFTTFQVFFVLVLVLAIVGAVWRVSVARRLARMAGIDEETAMAATLLSEDGFDTTYLAAALRSDNELYRPDEGLSVEERLGELEDLRRRGLITDEEYATARERIISSI